MKEISLNTCSSKYGDGLENYIVSMAKNDTDFFGLQETPFEKQLYYKNKIPDFNTFFIKKFCDSVSSYNLLFLINNKYKIVNSQSVLADTGAGACSCVTLTNNGLLVTLANVHGIPRPGNKMDTEARVKQSKLIIDFLGRLDGQKIIMGDFNLLPETKSVEMFEEAGYRNLIKEFNIKDTRGKINHDRYKDGEIQYFADYAFVSSGVKVKGFEVPHVEVSDHLPLILDFEL